MNKCSGNRSEKTNQKNGVHDSKSNVKIEAYKMQMHQQSLWQQAWFMITIMLSIMGNYRGMNRPIIPPISMEDWNQGVIQVNEGKHEENNEEDNNNYDNVNGWYLFHM